MLPACAAPPQSDGVSKICLHSGIFIHMFALQVSFRPSKLKLAFSTARITPVQNFSLDWIANENSSYLYWLPM